MIVKLWIAVWAVRVWGRHSHCVLGLVDDEHPVCLLVVAISLFLSGHDLRFKGFPVGNATIETLTLQNVTLDLDPVERNGTPGRAVALDAAQDSPCFTGWQGSAACGCRLG